VTVSVTSPPNRPPVITSLVALPPLLFAQPGGFSTIQGSITDPDGDPVTWKFERFGGGYGSLGENSGAGASAVTVYWAPPGLFGGSCVAL
jgi:hypothetical protein